MDESGHVSYGRVLSIAGVVGPEDIWSDFDGEWRQALEDVGAEILHMKDLAHFQGEYRGWDEDKRRKLMASALDIITSKPVQMYGVWFELDDWRAIPVEVQDQYIDPYLVSIQVVMQKLVEEKSVVGDDQRLHYIFERKKELEYKARQAFELLSKDERVL